MNENLLSVLFQGSYLKVIPQYYIAHLYCARFSRHKRANEYVHVQNVRDFPQVRLDREIKALFLLNERGDLRKKFEKNLSEGRKDIAESEHKTVTLGYKL